MWSPFGIVWLMSFCDSWSYSISTQQLEDSTLFRSLFLTQTHVWILSVRIWCHLKNSLKVFENNRFSTYIHYMVSISHDDVDAFGKLAYVRLTLRIRWQTASRRSGEFTRWWAQRHWHNLTASVQRIHVFQLLAKGFLQALSKKQQEQN